MISWRYTSLKTYRKSQEQRQNITKDYIEEKTSGGYIHFQSRKRIPK